MVQEEVRGPGVAVIIQVMAIKFKPLRGFPAIVVGAVIFATPSLLYQLWKRFFW